MITELPRVNVARFLYHRAEEFQRRKVERNIFINVAGQAGIDRLIGPRLEFNIGITDQLTVNIQRGFVNSGQPGGTFGETAEIDRLYIINIQKRRVELQALGAGLRRIFSYRIDAYRHKNL